MKYRGMRKRTMVTIVVVAVIFVAYFVISGLGARKTMEIPRELLVVSPDATGMEYEDVAFTSRDGDVTLKG